MESRDNGVSKNSYPKGPKMRKNLCPSNRTPNALSFLVDFMAVDSNVRMAKISRKFKEIGEVNS